MALDHFVAISNLGLLAEFNLGLWIMQVLLFCSSIFMMLLVLVQRGKGGGLTGALGGMGGQSAFGSKAGDAFTKITVITAVIWLLLCMVTIAAFNPPPKAKNIADEPSISGDDESADENAVKNIEAEGTAGIEKSLDDAADEEAAAITAETEKAVKDAPAAEGVNGESNSDDGNPASSKENGTPGLDGPKTETDKPADGDSKEVPESGDGK